MAAGHAVLSASGATSCRTLASSVQPDVMLVPAGKAGDETESWAPELLAETPVVRLAPDEDPVAAVAVVDEPDTQVTPPHETVVETPRAPVPALQTATAHTPPVETPRRTATLRSANASPTISDKLNEVRFGDYHAILELQPGASTYVVRQQYDTLRQLYTPAGWNGPVGPSELESLQEIGHGLDDAFAVLGHTTYQARYETALEAGASSRS